MQLGWRGSSLGGKLERHISLPSWSLLHRMNTKTLSSVPQCLALWYVTKRVTDIQSPRQLTILVSTHNTIQILTVFACHCFYVLFHFRGVPGLILRKQISLSLSQIKTLLQHYTLSPTFGLSSWVGGGGGQILSNSKEVEIYSIFSTHIFLLATQ
jgi:hypothetical protein